MIAICAGVLISILLLEILGFICLGRNKPLKALYSGCAISIIKNVIAEKLFPEQNINSLKYYEKIYFGGNARKIRLANEGGWYSLITAILFAVFGLIFVGKITGFFDQRYVSQVSRPASGSRTVKVIAEYDDSEISIDMSVGSKALSEAEKKESFDYISENLEKLVLGDNESLDKVTKSLVFKDSFGRAGVKASYYSSDYRIIDSNGNVYSKELTEDKNVFVTVTLSLEAWEVQKTLDITVKPYSKTTKDKNLIVERLEELESSNNERDSFDLPENIEGKTVKFKTIGDKKEYILAALCLVFVAILIPYGVQRRREKLKHRQMELIYDYSELVSKLILLLEAGLTIRGAFERVATDYEKRVKASGKRCETRYLYEEMIKARNEMQIGVEEGRAYNNFGKRCDNVLYIRLAKLLALNTKKGGASLIISLRSEMEESLRERREAIKKKGEEIRIKLLIPMMGTFCLLLCVIMVPALLLV